MRIAFLDIVREKFSMAGFLKPTVYDSLRFSALIPHYKDGYTASNPFVVTGLQKSKKLDKHTGCINTITWNQDGSRLVTGSDDRHIVVWEFPSVRSLKSIHSGHRNNIFCATFLEGSREVVTSSADGSVHLVDLESGSVEVLFENDFGAYCFKHVSDPKCPRGGLVTLSDGTVIRYDTRSASSAEDVLCIRHDSTLRHLSSGRFTAPPSATALAYNPIDPNLLALGTSTRAVLMYDVRFFQEPIIKIVPEFSPISESYPGETESVSDIVWDHRNRFIVNYCRQNLIEIDYNFFNGLSSAQIGGFKVGRCPEIPRQWFGRINHQTFLKEVAILDDEYILTGGDCGSLFVYERFGSQRLLFKKPADPYVLNCVAVHPNLPVVATSGIASIADIWEPVASFGSRIRDRNSDKVGATNQSSTTLPSTPPSSPPVLSDNDRMQIANILREEGNELYRSRNLEQAVSKYAEMIHLLSNLYTDTLMLDRNALLEKAWNNTAAVLIEMRNFEHAIDACDEVLSLNPNNVKALVRRAKCYNRLGDVDSFIEDMDRAVQLDPNNPELIRLMVEEDQETEGSLMWRWRNNVSQV